MREFVVVGHEAPTDGDFGLEDLAGAGRLDLLCRCVGAALFTSHGIREDARVHLVLGDAVTVTVDGATVRNARPDERSLAGLVRTALAARGDAIGHQPAEPALGVTVRTRGLAPTLEARGRAGTVIGLHEAGDPLPAVPVPEDPVFVLSDHRDFTPAEAETVAEAATHRVRLGPTILHADHATAVAHNWLDTEGYERY